MHDDAQPESTDDFRAPSRRPRCARPRCAEPPVADMARRRYNYSTWTSSVIWWGYCARHLAEYGRVVRDGLVWWVPDLWQRARAGEPLDELVAGDGDGTGDA